MIDLRPFQALYYDQARAGDLASVIAPPYDVIDTAALDRLYARSAYNVVRLTLNREADRYSGAARELTDWRARGVLVRDQGPCLYYYVQDFVLSDGSPRQRGGLIGMVRLERFSSGNIRPHERTFAGPKADRLRLISACRANLSPIFGIYPDCTEAFVPAQRQSNHELPWFEAHDDEGTRHRVWRLADAALISRIGSALKEATIFIADGHHRYETALTYRDQRRAAGDTDPEAPHNFVLMCLTSTEDPGLVVLPTHRVLRGSHSGADEWLSKLHRYFDVENFSLTPNGERELLARVGNGNRRGCFGLRLATSDRGYLLTVRDVHLLDDILTDVDPVVRYLDVAVVDAFVLDRLFEVECRPAVEAGVLTYTHDGTQALRAVSDGEATAALLLRPPSMADVQAVCRAGQTMPEKSTYFFPKLPAGLVFSALD